MEYGGSFEGFLVARGKDSRAESPAVARNEVGRVGGKNGELSETAASEWDFRF